ncbi:MAG TPA: thiamine phosphate synthase [Candidatus Saccharimonadales bacterium]|nr:thiamine phosphate synthase [Candidatus Saccharimonadales bacterium]
MICSAPAAFRDISHPVFRLYFISDSSLCPTEPPARPLVEAVRAGVEMVQVREKAMSAAELLAMTREAAAAAGPVGAEVYVNGRLDIAAAAGASGVHLPSNGIPVAAVRAVAPEGMRIGRSTHSPAEAAAAQKDGADFVVFGPVFETPSKARYGPPAGLSALGETLRAVTIPVYAIGGIRPENIGRVAALPVAGAAVISAIAMARDRAAAVDSLRAAARRARGDSE